MTDPSPTILVVDDEPEILEMLSLLLDSEGYRPLTALSGAAALELLARERVDLVLLDIMMPELDGLELLGRLRADPALAAHRVVMLTAKNDLDALARALDSGADGFVAKPFDLDALLELVAARLRGGPGDYYRSMEEGSAPASGAERFIFLHLLESDEDHSALTDACEECQHRLLSLWQEPHGEGLARTTALLWLETPEDLGKMINRVLAKPGLRITDCLLYRHPGDIPADIMQGRRP
jgi:DNA-binding response OmpR family regulator